jgi:hypothetical protein
MSGTRRHIRQKVRSNGKNKLHAHEKPALHGIANLIASMTEQCFKPRRAGTACPAVASAAYGW